MNGQPWPHDMAQRNVSDWCDRKQVFYARWAVKVSSWLYEALLLLQESSLVQKMLYPKRFKAKGMLNSVV